MEKLRKRMGDGRKKGSENRNGIEERQTPADINIGQETGGTVLISVIMPAYQAASYIARAIASVQGQTCQEPWELLVIDDCSTDCTAQIVRSYAAADPRIRYLRQKRNRGVAAARNLGIRKAVGTYAAFLDADDWWDADKLKIQMECIARTGAVLCCTGRELMQPNGVPAGRVISVPEHITYPMLLRSNVIPCGSVLVRMDAVREFGFVCDKYHEDYLLWLKILKKYKTAAGVNVPALKCRLSAGGKSRNKWKSACMQYGSYRYMGYGRVRSLYYMIFYTLNGLRKYLG